MVDLPVNENDVVGAYEAEFTRQPENRAEAGQLCKDCNTAPAHNPDCADCREHDGTCLRCPQCFEREGCRIATGLVELLHEREKSGAESGWVPIVDSLSRHALCNVVAVLSVLLYAKAQFVEDELGVPVDGWIATVRRAQG